MTLDAYGNRFSLFIGSLLAACLALTACEGAAGKAGPAGDPGEPGKVGDPGRPAPRAYLAGATIETAPLGLTATTDAKGSFKIVDVPTGIYKVTAKTTAVKLEGNDIVSGDSVSATVDGANVVGGKTTNLFIKVKRIPDHLNLVSMMDSTKTNTYKEANCIACHTDRKNEQSLDPKVVPFHCKGNAGRRTLYDPDRLQSPMLRVGPRGAAESFVPISWDEAIQLSASKLKAVRASYGPRALFYFCEDHSFNNIQVDFTDEIDAPAELAP